MGFKDVLGKVAEKIEDVAEDIKESREERRKQKEHEKELERERLRELEEIRGDVEQLLDKFTIIQLKNLCLEMIGRTPEDEIIREDKDYDDYDDYDDNDEEDDRKQLKLNRERLHRFNRKKSIKSDRSTYIEFIFEKLEDGDLKVSQIRDYALRRKIVTPSFFKSELDSDEEQREFENIMNSIQAGFEPERIKDEKELQAQLTIFLKAKFPDKKIEREVYTKGGDQLDIVVDGKFVFELKVPRNRTALRNLSAQLEEYKEEYPNVCAVIADISKSIDPDLEEPVEENLTQRIKEYADKYKLKLAVPTLIFNVIKRK